MPDRSVEVHLEAAGIAPARAGSTLHFFAPGERLRRTGGILLLALVLAASLIPIPLIHFIGPPIILITGIVTAVRQARATGRLDAVRIACPKCGGINRVGGGLGVRDPELPVTRLCEECRRVLTLSIHPAAEAAGSPPSG